MSNNYLYYTALINNDGSTIPANESNVEPDFIFTEDRNNNYLYYIYMKLKGGSLKVKEIKAFLEASYMEDPPKEIMGYQLDEKLSFLYGKVYVNHKMKKVVVVHRGTVENIDWANNALYALNSDAYKLTPRYKQGLKMQNDAHKKYKGYQFETAGHSQGALLAHLLGTKSKNGYLFNPAYKKEQLRDNEYVIRSSGDIVSKLKVFLENI